MSDSLPLSDLINFIVLNVVPCNRMHTNELPCYACVGLHANGYGLVSKLSHGFLIEGEVVFEFVGPELALCFRHVALGD